MRTLFISNLVPWPLDNGAKIRIHHVLRAVAEVSDVTLVCFANPGEQDRAGMERVREYVSEIYQVSRESCRYHQVGRYSVTARRVHGVLDVFHPLRPSLVANWWSKEAGELMELLRTRKFDLVWGEHLGSTNLLDQFRHVRRVVDLYDIESSKLRHQIRETPIGITLPLHYLEYLKLRRFEKRLPASGYEVLVCSDVDRRSLGGGPSVTVVPNGVELPPYRENIQEDATFLFPGTLDYAPNVDAAQHLCSQIFPRILRQIPHARLELVGRRPDASVRRLHDGKSVFVHGDVPDIGSFFRRATSVVVPIRFGGGTRIKILEAMGYRIPVISSTVGAEGIEARSGEHLILADDPGAFAEACVRVCREESLRARLATAGYHLVNSQYQWSSIRSVVKSFVKDGASRPESLNIAACQDTAAGRPSGVICPRQ